MPSICTFVNVFIGKRFNWIDSCPTIYFLVIKSAKIISCLAVYLELLSQDK